jgi:Uma2 family endonuclease
LGAPALVVEIRSPSTRRRDLGIKRQLFDRGGVREYWVIDPKALAVTVYRRMPDGGFPRVAVFSASGEASLTTALLPGFSLSVAKLFA